MSRPEVVAGSPWPKVTSRLPSILSGEEIEMLFAMIPSCPRRA